MARIFQIEELQEKKRRLLAESEVYRQTLILEVQNLRLYGMRLQRKLSWMRAVPSFFMLAPLAASVLRGRLAAAAAAPKRKSRWRRVLGTGLMGWRLYRQFGPLCQGMLSHRFPSRKTQPLRPKEKEPAANI